MSSRLYLQLNSPLKTVFENASPEVSAQHQQGLDSAESQRRFEQLKGAPQKIYRKPPSRRPQPVRLDLSAITRTPSALLHNDWYLNQLFNEVRDLYRPGALTGFPIRYSLESSDRHLSLLRDLAPGCRITPLFPSLLRSPERIRSAPTLRLSDRSPNFLLSYMPPKRKGVASSSTSKAKRSTGRKEPLDDEKHVFSAKSKLMKEDLTQFFASPLAWSSLTEEEKEEVRTLLPHDIPYDESGAPSQEYLRYDNDWRESLRLFSEDVQMGRYEPEWLEEAHAAAEARRRGDYDQWKEDQFEEFWGQKSDAHADLIAGKALQIRLGEMIEAGVFHVGDVFSYARSFGLGGNAYLVEKDLTIVETSGRALNFTAASGTHKSPTLSAQLPAAKEQQRVHSKARLHSGATRAQDKPVSEPLPQQRRRSNSVQSSQNSAPSSRPGTSGADHADEDAEVSKKRFGILKSFRRSSSPSENESGSGGLFNLRRKPVPKMEIVPASAGDQPGNDSDSPLSSLSGDEDMDLPAPWEVDKKSKGQAILRKLSIDRFTGARSTTPTGTASQQTTLSRRPLPSRANPSSQSKATLSRPSTSGSAVSSDSGQPDKQPPRRVASKKSEQTVTSTETTDTRPGESYDPVDPKADVLVSVTGIDSLHALEQKVLEIDGRRKGEPRANAWRTFHCRRGKLDLGSLAEMREEYYKAKHN